MLLHHFNPKTGADELVGPDDTAFIVEAEKMHQAGRHLPERLRRGSPSRKGGEK